MHRLVKWDLAIHKRHGKCTLFTDEIGHGYMHEWNVPIMQVMDAWIGVAKKVWLHENQVVGCCYICTQPSQKAGAVEIEWA